MSKVSLCLLNKEFCNYQGVGGVIGGTGECYYDSWEPNPEAC